jgi:hypothetical protein
MKCDDIDNRNCIKFISFKNKIIRHRVDTIGSKSEFFPKSFFKYKKKVFFINNKNKALNEEIIRELKLHGLLNSVYFDYTDDEIFNLNIETPVFVIDENNKAKKINFEYKK